MIQYPTTEEETERAGEKVRRLEVPSEYEATDSVLDADDVLNGGILFSSSHAGEEFLHILLDDQDTSGVPR